MEIKYFFSVLISQSNHILILKGHGIFGLKNKHILFIHLFTAACELCSPIRYVQVSQPLKIWECILFSKDYPVTIIEWCCHEPTATILCNRAVKLLRLNEAFFGHYGLFHRCRDSRRLFLGLTSKINYTFENHFV